MKPAALDPYKVQELRVLEKYTNHKEAMELLIKATRQVQPILRKRQWTVPIVREFFPDRKELLGLNVNGRRGTTDEIRIRLRPAHAPSAFLDFHAVLGTLLHELVHNVRGPHDAEFYKILDELWTDAEDLMDRGVSGTGAGFDAYAAGRAGDGTRHNPDKASLRNIAASAAERRARVHSLLPSGPRTVGGGAGARGPSLRGLAPREAARVAAERRAADDQTCGGIIEVLDDEEAAPVDGAGPRPIEKDKPLRGQRRPPQPQQKQPQQRNEDDDDVVVVVSSSDDEGGGRTPKRPRWTSGAGVGVRPLDLVVPLEPSPRRSTRSSGHGPLRPTQGPRLAGDLNEAMKHPFGFLTRRGRHMHSDACACCREAQAPAAGGALAETVTCGSGSQGDHHDDHGTEIIAILDDDA